MLKIIIFLILTGVFEVCSQCLTTLLVTGFADTPLTPLPMKYRIEKTKCSDGTPRKAIIVNVNFGVTSTTPMWTQVELLKKVMYPILEQHPEGVHVICFSLGTLTVRALIQETDNHTIHNVISAAGLHMGLSGTPFVHSMLGDLQFLTTLPVDRVEDIWHVCYNVLSQKTSTLCNIWRDEKKIDLYLEHNIFLPIINNEKPHSKSEKYKENLQKIKKLILLAGEKDETVFPWQSGLFGSEAPDGSIINMEEQPIYKNDVLGLKALNEKGAIIMHKIPNAQHSSFGTEEYIFDEFMLPYLE